MKIMKTIDDVVKYIKEQIGLTVVPDANTKIRRRGGNKYFNIVLSSSSFNHPDLLKLERFSNQYKTISISKNGVVRYALYFDLKE